METGMLGTERPQSSMRRTRTLGERKTLQSSWWMLTWLPH
ncbi:hypothetical protein LEMLEM_LOCUS22968 [Lemmus lemmus]